MAGSRIRRSRDFTEGLSVLAFGSRGRAAMVAIGMALLTAPRSGNAAGDGGDARDLVQFRQEIETLKGSEAAERRRVEQDEKHIQELEDQLRRLETQNQKLDNTTGPLENTQTTLNDY